jgi:hypothetical protein
MHYTGLVEVTDRFAEAASNDRATDWDDQYIVVREDRRRS